MPESDVARERTKLVGRPLRTLEDLIDRDAELTRIITCYLGYVAVYKTEIHDLMAQRTMVRARLRKELK